VYYTPVSSKFMENFVLLNAALVACSVSRERERERERETETERERGGRRAKRMSRKVKKAQNPALTKGRRVFV
jgi:hypothetical protein